MIKIMTIKEYEAVAMLDLSESERDTLGRNAADLAENFSALDAICSSGIEPLVSVLNLNNILREDASEKHLSRDAILSNAPEQFDGFFQVPGTLE